MVSVVADSDRGAGKATQKGKDGKLTWRFKAENVRDVTWATSNLYLWDATTAAVGAREGGGVPDTHHDLQLLPPRSAAVGLGRERDRTPRARSRSSHACSGPIPTRT